jgi:hypothetical protein
MSARCRRLCVTNGKPCSQAIAAIQASYRMTLPLACCADVGPGIDQRVVDEVYADPGEALLKLLPAARLVARRDRQFHLVVAVSARL